MFSEYRVDNYLPIDSKILDKNADLLFDIFGKVQGGSKNCLVLYASQEPR